MKKILKRIFLILLLLIVCLFTFVPYLIPLQTAPESILSPYDNAHFSEIQTLRLHYRIWTPNQAPVGHVLLVHGLFESTAIWEQTASELAAHNYLVVAVDLPGFGYSSRQTGFQHTQNNRSQLLWQLLDQITVKSSSKPDSTNQSPTWTLVGHSMGGACVAAMAANNPDQVEQLVLVNAALFENAPSFVKPALQYPPLKRWVAVIAEYFILQPRFVKNFLTDAYGQAPTQNQLAQYLATLSLPGSGPAFADIVASSANIPTIDIPTNRFPIVGIWGAKDSWTSLTKTKLALPTMTELLIDDAYHSPTETHAKQFNRLLLDCLSQ